MATYELLKQEGSAKRAVFHTVHGDIQTPVFMNVGTVAAIKGAVSTMDLKEIKCQVELFTTCLHQLLYKLCFINIIKSILSDFFKTIDSYWQF